MGRGENRKGKSVYLIVDDIVLIAKGGREDEEHDKKVKVLLR